MAYKIANIGKRLGTVYGETAVGARLEGVRQDRKRKEAHLPARTVMQYGDCNANEGKPWSVRLWNGIAQAALAIYRARRVRDWWVSSWTQAILANGRE